MFLYAQFYEISKYTNKTESFRLSWLGWPLWNICITNDHGYVSRVVHTSRSCPHSWLITRLVTWLTRRMPLVEQDLLTLLEHLNSSPVFSGVPVTRSFVLCTYFVDCCLSFLSFFFWTLCCLFFDDFRILITPLISSNCSKLHTRILVA
jgi:hypothetical protein